MGMLCPGELVSAGTHFWWWQLRGVVCVLLMWDADSILQCTKQPRNSEICGPHVGSVEQICPKLVGRARSFSPAFISCYMVSAENITRFPILNLESLHLFILKFLGQNSHLSRYFWQSVCQVGRFCPHPWGLKNMSSLFLWWSNKAVAGPLLLLPLQASLLPGMFCFQLRACLLKREHGFARLLEQWLYLYKVCWDLWLCFGSDWGVCLWLLLFISPSLVQERRREGDFYIH